MVKWIAAIEFVHDFAHLGAAQGGYNEDHEFYGYRMPILASRDGSAAPAPIEERADGPHAHTRAPKQRSKRRARMNVAPSRMTSDPALDDEWTALAP